MTALAKQPVKDASVQKKVQDAEEKASSFELDVQEFEIESQEDLEVVSTTLADIKRLNNELEAEKQKAVKPMNSALAIVRGWFKPTQDKLASLEAQIKTKIGQYHLKQEEAKRQALRAASEAMRGKGTATQVALAMEKMQKAQTERVDGMGVRYTYDIEIVDVEALPDEWWTPDEGAILRYVRKTDGEKSIPGVVFHKRAIVSSRS